MDGGLTNLPSGGGQQEEDELSQRVEMHWARMTECLDKGGGNCVPLGASEGGAEAIGANPNWLLNLGLWQHFFVAEEMMTKGRREERRSMSGGKGEDDTPEGWTFLNLASFVKTELNLFGRKWKWSCHKKWILYASLLVLPFIFVSKTSDTMWTGRKPKHVMRFESWNKIKQEGLSFEKAWENIR